MQKEEAEWVYYPGYGYQWVDPQIQAYRNYQQQIYIQQQIYQQPLSARRSYNNPNCGGDLYCGTGSAVGTGGYSGYGGYSGGHSNDNSRRRWIFRRVVVRLRLEFGSLLHQISETFKVVGVRVHHWHRPGSGHATRRHCNGGAKADRSR